MLFNRVISRFHSHYLSSPEANANLLRQFGIINPIIYRNLTYFLINLEFPNIMRKESTFCLLTQKQKPILSLTQEHSLLTQEKTQGMPYDILVEYLKPNPS